jgi:hypothetical protein
MPQLELALQPKQWDLLDLITNSPAAVIGVGGGRGAAKSSGIDRCALTLMYEQRDCLCCMVMRNWDQVLRYHIEAIRRDYPWLEKDLKVSAPAKLRIGRAEMDFSYAENYDDVERRFRSANYRYIFVDQAEQFSERELREMRKACRSAGRHPAKMILSFNMRGAGIVSLRKWFREPKELNRGESPEDYAFLKFNPWDNVEWVRPALEHDGYTVADYYAWTDEQRKEYAATRGIYTRQLASDDEAIRAADWEGSWDSIEGAYFANSFDLDSARIPPGLAETMRKSWATHWLGQDWGKAHFCATYWAYRVTLSPSEALRYLNWKLEKAINVSVIFREMIVSEMESTEVAQSIVDATPATERERYRSFFLSPDAFGERDSTHTIASKESKVLRSYGMPGAARADNDRKGGWGLMASLFQASKGKGWGTDREGRRFQYEEALLVSSECAELLRTIPMLMRDPKNIDDVLKTDKGAARIEQDVGDAARYLLKSMLSPRRKTEEDVYQEKMVAATPVERMMLAFRHEQRKMQKKRKFYPPSWRKNL